MGLVPGASRVVGGTPLGKGSGGMGGGPCRVVRWWPPTAVRRTKKTHTLMGTGTKRIVVGDRSGDLAFFWLRPIDETIL